MKPHELSYETTADTDIIDLTRDVESKLKAVGAQDGACLIFTPGSTASISTIEYEPGAVKDLKEALEKIAPKDKYYHHEEAWHDGNGYSHVRAALMKPGLTVPVVAGKLVLGTWQQLILLDFDNRPRRRTVLVQFLEG